MPTIKTTDVLAAGEVIQNVVAGNQFEFIEVPSQVQVYAVGEGVGVPSIEVFFGQELELPAAEPNIVPAAGGGPRVPDDEVVSDVAAPRDRLVIRIAETGGAAAVTIRTLTKISPMAVRA